MVLIQDVLLVAKAAIALPILIYGFIHYCEVYDEQIGDGKYKLINLGYTLHLIATLILSLCISLPLIRALIVISKGILNI